MNNHDNISDEKPPILPVIIGTGFGSGFWPWGPGTAGSILGVAIWMALTFIVDATSLGTITLSLAIFFTLLGTWATAQLQPYWGEDPSRVVVDEMVGVWIPLCILKPDDYIWAIVALVLFRFFDIVKPLGIKKLDQKSGAIWVMLDDVLGGVYAMIAMIIIKIISLCAILR